MSEVTQDMVFLYEFGNLSAEDRAKVEEASVSDPLVREWLEQLGSPLVEIDYDSEIEKDLGETMKYLREDAFQSIWWGKED